MLLIGTFNWAKTVDTGVFVCPNCNSNESYRLRESRAFLTIYFIPVVPISGKQTFVECKSCKLAFEPSIIAIGSEDQAATQPSISFAEDLLAAIAVLMVEDGHVTDAEIKRARVIYQNMLEQNLSRDALGNACAVVQQQRLTAFTFLATAIHRRSQVEQIMMLQAMFGVASAEGELSPNRLKALADAANIMGLEQGDFQRAINDAGQWLGA